MIEDRTLSIKTLSPFDKNYSDFSVLFYLKGKPSHFFIDRIIPVTQRWQALHPAAYRSRTKHIRYYRVLHNNFHGFLRIKRQYQKTSSVAGVKVYSESHISWYVATEFVVPVFQQGKSSCFSYCKYLPVDILHILFIV